MHPADKHYRNTVLKLPDLTVTEDVLDGITFENCHLVGPAVLIPLGQTEITGCSFDGELDAVLWPIDDGRPAVTGAIGLNACRLVGCRLTRLGLAVPRAKLDDIRQGFRS